MRNLSILSTEMTSAPVVCMFACLVPAGALHLIALPIPSTSTSLLFSVGISGVLFALNVCLVDRYKDSIL